MSQGQVERWIEGYILAWNTNRPDEIARLFAEDARYYPSPFAEPWRGREGIVASWLERQDRPGSFNFHYQVLATNDDLAVVRGWTEYFDPPREYSNIWVVRFDREGRCDEFTEWWMERPQ